MNRMRRGKLPLPKEEMEAEMFEYIIQEMERAGFEHYEISNFSKPGFESRHNLMYWDNAEYYGLGAGASGYVDGIRYKNHGPIRHYMQAVEEGNARVQEEHLTQTEMMEEEMFLGLRKKTGVSRSVLKKSLVWILTNNMDQWLRNWSSRAFGTWQGHCTNDQERSLLGDTVAEKFILSRKWQKHLNTAWKFRLIWAMSMDL